MSMQITDHAVMTNTPHWTAQPSPSTGKPTHSDDAHKEDSLDEALEEFFPASDPPAVGTST
jgi:hypothetical protein